MPPTFGNGKICYLQIPAEDIARSASFYQQVFGWNIRQNTHGHTSFDDTVGQVSGAWVMGRPPASTPGILVYIMVDSVAASIEAITAAGGKIVQPVGGDPGEITARFSDPAGNVVGLYEHKSKT
jgi:uncharacterized protein